MNTVQIVRSNFGRYFFVRLVSPNGQVLAHSEIYYSKWNAKRAARKNFPGLPIVEVGK